MTDRDIPGGLDLCRAAGWNQTREDWELFLQLGPGGSCVAVDDGGQVRGTVATIRYGKHFCWIGMVLVDPAYQRRGIGIQLLRESLKLLDKEKTIKLDATPAGRQVYLRLGFSDEYGISRLIRDSGRVKVTAGIDVRPVREGDLPTILALDFQTFGAERYGVLRSLFERSPDLAWILERDGETEAYCFGRQGHNFAQIGPVIARNLAGAKAVLSAALISVSGRPVILDAPHHSPGWRTWLATIGFSEQRPLVRMYKGANDSPGKPTDQFAILGPEFG